MKKNQADALANERANELKFQECLSRQRQSLNLSSVAMNANTKFTSNQSAVFDVVPDQAELVGRIRLTDDSTGLYTSNIYIGNWPASLEKLGFADTDRDAFEIYSWTAPVAGLFYQAEYESTGVSASAAVTRTFRRDKTGIVDFEDSEHRPVSGEIFPTRTLVVPAPPQAAPTQNHSALVVSSNDDSDDPTTASHEPLPEASTVATTPSVLGEKVRAPEILRAALEAPRTAELQSAVATLQRRQHELITRPAHDNLFVQGDPGTGKTIIAAHRTVFLISPHNDGHGIPDPLRAMLIGPSRAYCNHVRSMLSKLAPNQDRYILKAMPEIIDDLLSDVSSKTYAPNEMPSSAKWVDRDLFEIAWMAVEIWFEDYDNRYKESLTKRKDLQLAPIRVLSAGKKLSACYENFRDDLENILDRQSTEQTFGEGDANEIEEAQRNWQTQWQTKLQDALPDFDQAKNSIDQRWLLAMMSFHLNASHRSRFAGIGHIVIDEVQDLLPIEIQLLKHLNSEGHWSLVGDFNQQSSLLTSTPTWEFLQSRLGLPRSQPQRLELALRTPAPIMRLARALVGQEASLGQDFRADIELPRTYAVNVKRRGEVTSRLLDQFHEQMPEGLFAIILTAEQREEFESQLFNAGWRNPNRTGWNHAERPWTKMQPIPVLTPVESRGLEFDAVIVIDPDDFARPKRINDKKAVSRQLYMAVTRANKSLALVHSRKLSPELLRHTLPGELFPTDAGTP